MFLHTTHAHTYIRIRIAVPNTPSSYTTLILLFLSPSSPTHGRTPSPCDYTHSSMLSRSPFVIYHVKPLYTPTRRQDKLTYQTSEVEHIIFYYFRERARRKPYFREVFIQCPECTTISPWLIIAISRISKTFIWRDVDHHVFASATWLNATATASFGVGTSKYPIWR